MLPIASGALPHDLSITGALQADLTLAPDQPSTVRVHLTDFSLSHASGHLSVNGINGDIRWSNKTSGTTRLHWASARILGIAMGGGILDGTLLGSDFVMNRPLRVSSGDGYLQVDDFRARDIVTEQLEWQLAGGRLHSVSLEHLLKGLGWNVARDTLTASFPRVRHHDAVIESEGPVDLELFDGDVRIDNMRIEDAFGLIPSARANITLRDLSLGAITQPWNLSIEGRIDGEVRGLLLEDWRLRQFDEFWFATAEPDTSPHRISLTTIGKLARQDFGLYN